MSPIIVQSPRLFYRQWNVQDAPFLFELNNDPEVVRYTGDTPFKSEDDAADFIRNYDHYRLYGYGRWLCVMRDTGQIVGWCGLKNQMDELGIVDLGFRILRSQWGLGLATEAARTVLDYGFGNLELDEITARVAIGNTKSEAVIRKCDMHFSKESTCDHHPARWFILRRDEWLLKQPNRP